jgi:hypothetical protein
MLGTSSPSDKLTGDFGNEIEAISISDLGLLRLLAGKLSLFNFGLLQQYRSLATNSASRAMSHMPLFATEIADIEAEHFRSALLLLDVNLLCNGDGVVYLDA